MDRQQIRLQAEALQRQLDNPKNLGRKRPDGTYFFPRTRKARWRAMMEYYELLGDEATEEGQPEE